MDIKIVPPASTECGRLMTEELRQRLPRLYDQENNADPMVYIKFFTPDSSWTWLVTEGQLDGDDFRFFGYVIGLAEEWGYFVLSELETARGPRGLPIERDLFFQAGPFSRVIKTERHPGQLTPQRQESVP